jgi:DNA-binding NtrC family response regulator
MKGKREMRRQGQPEVMDTRSKVSARCCNGELNAMTRRPMENVPLERSPRPSEEKGRILGEKEFYGESLCMQKVYEQIRQAASTDVPVLILGETGTGKELVARAIHLESDRREGLYIPVNLGAIPTELVGSELFGHERGAFTGAAERNKGRFEQAEGGTLFLDEIATIDEKMQVSLLRIIEQKEFYRLGNGRAVRANVRLIAASNEDLAALTSKGRFREDLYYRLDVFRISVPRLQERRGDVALLIERFLRRYSEEFAKNVVDISSECMGILESYKWPGNVRELKNVIQRAVLVCTEETLLPEHLPPRFLNGKNLRRESETVFEVGTSLDRMEREMIVRTLEAAGNNRTRAAELLGISRRALYNKLQKHNLR